MGPWLVPFHDERQIADIRLTTRVNGELRQDDRTSRMIFGFRFLISYISTFVTLQPGDVIVTGTRSEEHTSELQSPMRISYALFCLHKKITYTTHAQPSSRNQQILHALSEPDPYFLLHVP